MKSLTRRSMRAVSAAVVIAAFSLALPSPSIAETPVPSTGEQAAAVVGEPELLLVESAHATGTTLELGNAKAQETGPADAPYTAPAAVFTISGSAANVHAQAIVFSPVSGMTNTYVISAQDGRVLSRRDNAAADFRYLQLTERTIEDAAGDPYAQWAVVDAGDGTVYLQNVQRDPSGEVPALDLYNWKTAAGSEVQTYSAGTAAVQKWRLRSLVPTVSIDSVTRESGTVPTMPTLVRAVYSWGFRFEMTDLDWDMPDTSVWSSDGTVTVTGTGIGAFGEDVPLEARFVVGSFSDGDDATYTTFAGAQAKEVQMRAPRSVVRHVSGSEEAVTSPVVWDFSQITDATFAAAGTVTIQADESTGFAARLVVTVVPATTTNILRGDGVNHIVAASDGSPFALTDGVRDVTGFSDWRSGGAANRVNPNTVTFFFDEPRQVTGVAVFDINGRQNIGGVTVQYRTLIGGWADLPGATWPAVNTSADLRLEVSSDPVVATGVRVIVTNKSTSTWMSLSEIEVTGPAVGPS